MSSIIFSQMGPSFYSCVFFFFFCLLGSVIPLVAGQTRPSYHIIPQTKWMNDPQRPFFVRGEYHLYYLWNSDWNTSHSTGGGTEWYHVTSYDMVHWTRQGVAIRKYQPNPSSGVILGDLWSGSCVVDTRNSTGFGQDAVIVIVTQAQDDIQQQSLFYSQDTGYTFSAYDKNPILPNPGPEAKPAFRDPKVIWDDKAGHWVTALAEGSKIGFYTSSDLKIWNYVSGFSPIDSGVDLGLLECPDLYQIDLDGNTTARVWILAASANGYLHGKTTGTVYWVGTWNGTHFTTRNSFPQWMDEGPDFYATVSWENPNDKYGSRYAIGWMNNWEYANTLPYYNDYAGQMSLVREVKYRTINGIPALVSLPIAGYDAVFSRQVSVYGTTITTDPATASLPANLTRGAYVIRANISKARYDDGNQVHIRIKSNEGYNTTIGYDFAEARAFLARDSDGTASDALGSEPKKVWDAVRSGVNHAGGSTVQLAIYVDYNSVEVFVNEGVPTLSGLIYPNQGAEGIEIVSDVGNLTLTLLTCASFTG